MPVGVSARQMAVSGLIVLFATPSVRHSTEAVDFADSEKS